MCKVSVIVPVFNAASSLRRCLDSILSQTLEDIEVICVDDGSTDGSAAILSEYSGADGRLHVVTFPSQRGVCAARNAGIDAARGEFLGFVDSDDSIRSDFFGLLVSRAVETGCDVVKGVIECSDFGSGKPVAPPAGMILDDSIACEKGFFLRGVMSAIFRRSLVASAGLRFPEDCIIHGEYLFVAKAVLAAPSVEVVKAAVYDYSVRVGSLTNGRYTVPMLLPLRGCFLEIMRLLVEAGVSESHLSAVVMQLMETLLQVCRRANIDRAALDEAVRIFDEISSACPSRKAVLTAFVRHHRGYGRLVQGRLGR